MCQIDISNFHSTPRIIYFLTEIPNVRMVNHRRRSKYTPMAQLEEAGVKK